MHVVGNFSKLSQTYGSFEKQRELPVFQKEQIEKKKYICASCCAKYFLTSAYGIGFHELPDEPSKK